MITKKALLGVICDLDKDISSLATRVGKIESVLLEKEKPGRRKPGRPRKDNR